MWASRNLSILDRWHLTLASDFFCFVIFMGFCVFILRGHWRDDRKVLGWREGSRISKGPQGGNRTRAAVSAVALYVDALTMKLSAPTDFSFNIFYSLSVHAFSGIQINDFGLPCSTVLATEILCAKPQQSYTTFDSNNRRFIFMHLVYIFIS